VIKYYSYMTTPARSQAPLLREAMNARGWSVADLHREVTAAGFKITPQAVRVWFAGGGIKDPIRELLMDLLGLDAEAFIRASARRARDKRRAS